MYSIPSHLSPEDRAYCLDIAEQVADLSPAAPPERLREVASKNIKWGQHRPNVHTGLLGVVPTETGYEVFIRAFLLNVQWTIVKEPFASLDEAVVAWEKHAIALGAPRKIRDRQAHLYAGRP